jgi:type IV secretion system protein VirD4
LVLVSGLAPIRAKKARYFEDRRLTARILPPPNPDRAEQSAVPGDPSPRHRKNDWSALVLPAKSAANPVQTVAKQSDDEDPANGGIRREPEIPEHEAVAPETSLDDALPEEPDDEEAIRARALRSRIRSVARQAAMDPDDGIAL